MTVFLKFMSPREGVENRLFRGHVPYQGGGGSTPLNLFFCIVIPYLSTGSNEICIKIEKKSTFFFFCPLSGLWWGGLELRGHVPYKVEFFFLCPP